MFRSCKKYSKNYQVCDTYLIDPTTDKIGKHLYNAFLPFPNSDYDPSEPPETMFEAEKKQEAIDQQDAEKKQKEADIKKEEKKQEKAIEKEAKEVVKQDKEKAKDGNNAIDELEMFLEQ